METSIVSSALLEAGLAALQQAQHDQAIGFLEAFCKDCAVNDQLTARDYLRAQMHLVEIYEQTGQGERAALLCYQLANCNNAQVQIWARQRLQSCSLANLDVSFIAPHLGSTIWGKFKQYFQTRVGQKLI